MLTETEYKKYAIASHGLLIDARDYISSARSQEPSRMVGAYAKCNVVSSLMSNKMGTTISVESRTAERAFFLLCDNDDAVIEMWDQPPIINIVRTTKNEIKRKGSYTPDFLILTSTGPIVIEVKTKEDVKKLLIKQPDDWELDSKGEYRYLPAYKAFSEIGLTHRVFVYSNKLRYLIANLETLMRSRQEEEYSQEDALNIFKAFDKFFVWSLHDLKNELSLGNYTQLIQMIDNKILHININEELLTLPKSCFIAKSKKLLEVAKQYRDKRQLFKNLNTQYLSVLAFPSQRVAEATMKKLQRIESGESSSSIRKWKQQIRDGAKNDLSPFQSLVTRYCISGNREPKVSKKVDLFVSQFIKESFSKQSGISIYRSHIQYKVAAKKEHPAFDPVSYMTYLKRITKVPEYKIAYEKGGKRAANAASEPTDPMQRSLKAKVAWQTVAIDHCLAKIYLVYYSSTNETYVLRPWITGMIDLCTSKVLAVTISFQSPSRTSTAKVMRECVRKHGKLPSEIIVDRGSDFTSVYFVSLLAHYGVTYTLRPSGHSRFGGEVEGFFGEFKKQWLSQRQGNMNDYKNARGIDGKKTPRNMAVLSPYDFYRELQEFCDWRDNKSRGFHHQSATYHFNQSEDNFPFFAIPVEYNHDFILATAVDSKAYSIDFRRGLHIGDFWYWHPDIGKVRGKKSKLEVRIDPENPHVVYALIENQWVSCSNAHINAYSAKDPVSQLVDGLLYNEVSIEKNKIKISADEELAQRIKDIDGQLHSSTSDKPFDFEKEARNASDKKISNVTSIFKQFKNKTITPIELNYWSKK